MINTNMHSYNYYVYEDSNGYGQPTISDVKGTIKLSINVISQSVGTSIKYKDSSYIGVTHNTNINDTYIIQYNNERLKVNYINKIGRYILVYMSNIWVLRYMA